MKRFCRTLDLKDDPQMIRQYIEAHRNVWPEIREGIREVGILDMQIYISGNHMFMIMDTTDDFDWEKDNERLDNLPRQKEWETFVGQFQVAEDNAESNKKWRLMDLIFKL